MTSVDAAAQLAGSRLREGRPHEAAAAYGAALRLMPGSAALWSDRGISLNQAGRRSEAFAAYEAALRLDPTHTNAYNNLAVARHAEGDADGAARAYHSAARLMVRPRAVVLLNLLRCTLDAARWQHWPLLEWFATRSHEDTARLAGSSEWPWARLEARAFLTGIPALLHAAAALEASAVLAAAAQPWRCGGGCPRDAVASSRPRDSIQRLRLALISDLDADPSASLLTSALPMLHAASQGLSVSLLSFSHAAPSEHLESISRAVPTYWLPAAPVGLSDGRPAPPACEAQRALEEIAPHIGLEAMSFLPGQRLDLLARRCSRPPVTLSLLRNFHGSMAASFIDYALADRAALPPRRAAAYIEAVVLLPHYHLVNAHGELVRLRPRPPPTHWPRTAPIACSLNRLNKLEPIAFSAWIDALTRAGGHLWVATGAGGGRRYHYRCPRSTATLLPVRP